MERFKSAALHGGSLSDFSQLFRRSIENYPIYYLTGYILWQTFTGATNAAVTTLVDNKLLLLKVKFPMDLFILTRVYTALINLGYSLVAYALMLVVFQVTPKWTMLFTPFIILCLITFSLGISYMLATAYVFLEISCICIPWCSLFGCTARRFFTQ